MITITILASCGQKRYIINVNVNKENSDRPVAKNVEIILGNQTFKTEEPQYEITKTKYKKVKKWLKREKKPMVQFRYKENLFYEKLDTVTAFDPKKEFQYYNFILKEKDIKGSIIVGKDSTGLGGGKCSVSVEGKPSFNLPNTKDSSIFTFKISNKGAKKWKVKIELSNMDDYLDTTCTFEVTSKNIHNHIYVIKPIPNKLPDSKLVKEAIESMEHTDSIIEQLKDKLNKLPGGKENPAYEDLGSAIQYIESENEQLRNEFDTLQKQLENGVRPGIDTHKLLVKTERTLKAITANEAFAISYLTIANVPKKPAELRSEFLWNSSKYKYNDLGDKGKKAVNDFIERIKNLRQHRYLASIENNQITISINIWCSADKEGIEPNEERFKRALDILKKYNVTPTKEDSTSDIGNYQLSVERGAEILHKIMQTKIEGKNKKEQFIYKSGYDLKIKFYAYGSSKADAQPNPNNKNDKNSAKDRYAKILYNINRKVPN